MGAGVSERKEHGSGRANRLPELQVGYDAARAAHSRNSHGIRRTVESAIGVQFDGDQRKTERIHQAALGHVAESEYEEAFETRG